MKRTTFVTRQCSSQTQFVSEHVHQGLFIIHYTLLFVSFFKSLIPYTGSLDKCHNSPFNALIIYAIKLREERLIIDADENSRVQTSEEWVQYNSKKTKNPELYSKSYDVGNHHNHLAETI